MSYNRVKQPKISDVIMEQMEAMILEGTLKPGPEIATRAGAGKTV